MVHDSKRVVADGILGSETRRITRELLAGLAGGEPLAQPPSFEQVEDAVAELLACFGVYRTYLPEGREHLDRALELARAHRPDLAATLEAIAPLLADGAAAPSQRFQQTSGMVMAKGVEDCAFYRWSRLTSLNEVGGDPSVFSVSPAELHEAMTRRQAEWPHAMSASSTHDTKRGEDVRARISVLAELPEEWDSALTRLLELVPVPDPGFAALLWQAVLGAWPASRERLHAYVEKAMREAGDHTTWTAVDEGYERAMHACVDAVFDDAAVREVFDSLVAAVDDPGWSNALGAKLLTLTAPGVPDVYQGSELWEQSLVDPDNRRPVDWSRHYRARAETAPTRETMKFHLIRRILGLRAEHPEAFFGSYEPLDLGPDRVGYVRGGRIRVVVPLRPRDRADGDGDLLPEFSQEVSFQR
jgi:(1->4)-alpha-D-glucan 1-alpha-D-glucosylmutase